MRRLTFLGVWALSAGLAPVFAESASVVVLFGGEETKVASAMVEGGELAVPASELAKVNGFQVKPMGLCSSERCVPAPKDGSWFEDVDGVPYVKVSRMAEKIGQPMVADLDRKIWAIGVAADDRSAALELGQAPDFALPDRTGKIVRLSDFRGKKVLLLTWASWCGCSLDLVGWQKVYEELKDENFVLVAVAQDTAGEAAAGKFYDRAQASYVTLIDQDHLVTELYQMVNVPMGVWIDEQGRMARPPEVAYTDGFKLLGQAVGDKRYVPALRDWVRNGAESKYVLSRDDFRSRLSPDSSNRAQAELEFRIGAYLYRQNDQEGAKEHWAKAQAVDPDNWNYHRQDWSFEGAKAMTNWLRKVRALEGKPYYEPIDFPAESTNN